MKAGGADVRILEGGRSSDDAVEINAEAIDIVEGVAERLRSGVAVGVAIVEVRPNGDVATNWTTGGYYHFLLSGAARLQSRIANE